VPHYSPFKHNRMTGGGLAAHLEAKKLLWATERSNSATCPTLSSGVQH
jgi:hypothetical protein